MDRIELLSWTEDFSVGDAKIDEQHKQLFNMINRLITESETTIQSETVSDLLTDMTNYAQEHFAAEEKLMRKHNYPHLEEHIAQHLTFRIKVLDFCKDAMKGVGGIPSTMLSYLRDWLVEHILKSDKAFKPYVCKKKFEEPFHNNK